MTEHKGFFITLEGPEGSGKSTQARLLATALQQKGLETLVTAEPGGDALAEEIRNLVLNTESPIVPESELLLYLAARAQHVRHVIIPALDHGKIVVCDRYADSSVAYQGYGRGINIAALQRLNKFATGGLLPNLTILLDVPVEIGLKRQQSRNRFEAESVEFHKKVREGFLKIARHDADRCVRIEALGSIGDVSKQLMETVTDRLRLAGILEGKP